jgi:divalent metal cation (Fe/Co/Zn/Cd) transporter
MFILKLRNCPISKGSIWMSPKSTLNITIPKKMGRLDKMITFSVLIIVMILVSVSLVISWQYLGRPIFQEAVFGLTNLILGFVRNHSKQYKCEKTNGPDKITTFSVLIIVMLLVYVALVASWDYFCWGYFWTSYMIVINVWIIVTLSICHSPIMLCQ